MPVSVRHAEAGDVGWFASRLRQADLDEFAAIRDQPIAEALKDCMVLSRGASFAAVSERLGPISLFGFAPHNLLSDKIAPWAVGTPDLVRRGTALRRFGVEFSAKALERGKLLENYVDVRNTASIRWLKSIGYEFAAPAPYGHKGLPFMRFWMTKDV